MDASLIGKRVLVVINEDGTPEPPKLPAGTIMRRLAAPDRDDYYLIRLDSPVECPRASTGANWVLHDLIVATRQVGTSMIDAFVTARHYVWVTIANDISPLAPTARRFDFAQTAYFALGQVFDAT